jgi:hypothetical protein
MSTMDSDQPNENAPDESDDEDLGDRIFEDGEEVAYQDWDSRGPGAGAGCISVYKYAKKFYVSHDAGIDGPFATKAEAISVGGVDRVSDATTEIWGCE